jgi:hypothetical protein
MEGHYRLRGLFALQLCKRSQGICTTSASNVEPSDQSQASFRRRPAGASAPSRSAWFATRTMLRAWSRTE